MNPTATEPMAPQPGEKPASVRVLPSIDPTRLILRSMAIGLDIAKHARPWVALCSATAFFGYTLADPTWLRLSTCAVYTFLVYLLPNLIPSKEE